jgi:hypothetical protein
MSWFSEVVLAGQIFPNLTRIHYIHAFITNPLPNPYKSLLKLFPRQPRFAISDDGRDNRPKLSTQGSLRLGNYPLHLRVADKGFLRHF